MTEKNVPKRILFALLIGLGGAAAGFLAPALLIPAVAAAAFVGVCWGWGYAAVVAALTVGGIAAGNFLNAAALISGSAAVLLSAAVLTVGLKRKFSYRAIAVILAVIVFAALYCGVSLPSILAGGEPYGAVTQVFREVRENAVDEYLKESVDMMLDAVPNVFFGALIMLAEGAGFLMLILARFFASRGGAELRPMAKFAEWHLPRSLKAGLPLLAAGIIILFIAKFAGATAIMYAAVYLLMPLFVATGTGCLLFIISRRREGGAFPVIFVALIVLMAPLFAAIIGVADLYAGVRRRLIRTDKLIREAFEKAEREKRDSVVVDFGDGRGPQVIAVRRKNNDAFFDGRTDEEGEHGAGPEANGDGSSDNHDGGDDHEGDA